MCPYGESLHRREPSWSSFPAARSQKPQAPDPASPARVYTLPPLDFQPGGQEPPTDPPREPLPDEHPYVDHPSLYRISATITPTTIASFSTNSSGYGPAAHIPAASLRDHSPSSHLTTELWAEIWMHPRISDVVELRIQQLSQGEFKFTIPFQIMHIFDLQTVYRLSNAGWSDPEAADGNNNGAHRRLPRIRFPDNTLLEPTQAIRLAREISQPFVNNHIAPAAYLLREMQLRALVSILSYIRLCVGEDKAGKKKPQLGHESQDTLQNNIRKLAQDLHLSQGSAADKGDCEFLLRYAQNLLSSFRSDHGAAFKAAAGFANIAFAMGHAGQYNSHGAQLHLRRAISQITPRAAKWHDGFDEMHHICMIVLAWSQYSSDGRSRSQFREVCMAMIAELRAKLRDGLAGLNTSRTSYTRSRLKKMTDAGAYLVDLNPVGDNPAFPTYGWMYLIGRLIERFMADGGPQSEHEKHDFVELVQLLVEACQTTEYDEVRYKAHEILFIAFGRSREGLQAVENLTDDRSHHGDPYRRNERNIALRAAWNEHMDGLMQRKEWVEATLTQLRDDDSLRNARQGHQQPVMQSEQMVAPKLEHDGSFGQKMISFIGRGRTETSDSSLRDEAKNVVSSLVNLKDRKSFRRKQSSPIRMEKQPSRDSNHSRTSLSSNRSHGSGASHRSGPVGRTPELQSAVWTPHPSPKPSTPQSAPMVFTTSSTSSHHLHPSTTTSSPHTPPTIPLNFRTPLFTTPSPRQKLPASPLSAHLSPTSHTISFLSPKLLTIFTITPTALHPLTTLAVPVPSSFTRCALTDQHLAALTPTSATFLPLSPPGVPLTVTAPGDTRFTSLAITSSTLAIAIAAPADTISITLYSLPNLTLTRELRIPYEFPDTLPPSIRTGPLGEARHLTFSPSGRYLHCALSTRGVVLTWDLTHSSRRPARFVPIPVNDGQGNGKLGITGVAASADGGVVVTTGGAGYLVHAGSSVIERVSAGEAGLAVSLGPEGDWGILTKGGRVYGGRGATGEEVGGDKVKGGVVVGWERRGEGKGEGGGGELLVVGTVGGRYGGVTRIGLQRG